VDERTNFNKSTLAAARYLRDRRLNLDDNWLLVVASYNWGIGNVWNAMERCGKENPTFWDIKKYLPEETKAYVMNFITLNVIYKNYDKFLKNNLVFKPVKQTVPAGNFEDIIAEEPESSKTVSLK
jgi:membrane-bound lytic murein transglycosylase D